MSQGVEGHCSIQGKGKTFMQRESASETGTKLSLHLLQKRWAACFCVPLLGVCYGVGIASFPLFSPPSLGCPEMVYHS